MNNAGVGLEPAIRHDAGDYETLRHLNAAEEERFQKILASGLPPASLCHRQLEDLSPGQLFMVNDKALHIVTGGIRYTNFYHNTFPDGNRSRPVRKCTKKPWVSVRTLAVTHRGAGWLSSFYDNERFLSSLTPIPPENLPLYIGGEWHVTPHMDEIIKKGVA